MKVQCCVCKKIREDGHWVYPSQPLTDPANVSHGYCPECAANAFAQLSSIPRVVKKPAEDSSNAA